MKTLKWILRLIVILAVTYIIYKLCYEPADRFQSIYLVPQDAICVIESDKPYKTWKTLKNNLIWNHLHTNTFFEKLTNYANYLDSLMNENRLLFRAFGSKKTTISFHEIRKEIEYLIITDIKRLSKLKSPQKYLTSLLGNEYEVTARDFHKVEILEIFDLETNKILYASLIKNQLLLSYSHLLIEAAILQKDEPVIGRDLDFIDISSQMFNKGQIRFYMSYKNLTEYLYSILLKPPPALSFIKQNFKYTGLSMDLDDNLIDLKGYNALVDTSTNPIKALIKSGKGNRDIVDVIPNRIAVYLSFGFNHMLDFVNNFESSLSHSPDEYKKYMENLAKIENKLKINIKKDFFSWMDNEMAIIQTQPTNLGRDNEYAIIFEAASDKKAKQKMEYLNAQVKKHTPVKFKTITYKNYTINYLSIGGFFKLLLGRLLAKINKPYYTIIDNYVIFSNHPQTLKSIIDDYVDGNTLGNSLEYYNIINSFSNSSNLFIYIQPPVLFTNMKGIMNAGTWSNINSNKDYITCFPQIGFQLETKGKLLASRLLINFSEPQEVVQPYYFDFHFDTLPFQTAESPDQVGQEKNIFPAEIILNDLDKNKHVMYFENGNIKYELDIKDGRKHGNYKEYYINGTLKIKGKFKNDTKHGLWKLYDENGKLIREAKYDHDNLIE